MALDPRFIASIAFEQYMVDNATGLPLAGGYMEFYKDSDRITPKPVYQIQGDPPNYTYIALPNPLSLSAVGTPVNNSDIQVNVYAFPYDEDGNVENYYVKVYNSEDQFQFDWVAWPNVTAEDNPDALVNGYQNQLANPQFSVVNFIPDQGMTIVFDSVLDAVEYDIAPGWVVVISSSGAGTVAIEKLSIAGSLQIQTNPPDFISFQPTGSNITNLILRQKLTNNPDIWSTTLIDNGYVSSCMLITSYDGQAHTLEMEYVQSAGPSSPQTLVSGSTGTEGYVYLNDTVLLDAGTNTDDSDTGAIYIDIVLPTIGHYGITSVQVVGTSQENITVDFQQEPVNRQKSQLFYYYQTPINFKPIKSYLCGWDFPLNPAQFNGSSFTLGSYQAAYIWDQTIGFQNANSSLAASRVSSGPAAGSFKINAINTSQFAIVQYLTVPQIIDLLSNDLSSNIVLSSDVPSLQGTISLWYSKDGTVPNIGTTNTCLISTLNSIGKPLTLNGNWTEVKRSSLGDAIFTLGLAGDIDNLQSFGFNGWNLSDTELETLEAITYFAIVVGFASIENTKNIIIKSCSLVPGKIPTIPESQTYDDALKDCRYYYEMTYVPGTIPGSASILGAKMTPAGIFNPSELFQAYPYIFSDYFIETKITPPLLTYYAVDTGSSNEITFYSNTTSGSVDAIFSDIFSINGSITVQNANWGVTNNTPRINVSGLGSEKSSCVMTYQRTADSRIGIY